MRQLTTIAEQQRLSSSQDVYWVMEICTEDGSMYLSQRPLICEEYEFEPIIQELSIRLRTFPEMLIPTSGRGRSSTVIVRVLRSSPIAENLIFFARQGVLQGTLCRIGLFLKDATQSPSFADIIWCGWFTLTDGLEDRESFTILLSDIVNARYERVAGRVITPEISDNLTRCFSDTIIPFLFGRCRGVQLLPYRFGMSTSLVSDLTPDDRIIPVLSLEQFPASGVVQVGNELISYTEVDLDVSTLGTPTTPVVREHPAFHRAGMPVYVVPDGGFAFLVADHQCLAIERVYTKNSSCSAEEYQVGIEQIQGKEVTTIVFPRLPVQCSYEPVASQLEVSPATFPGVWSVDAGNTAFEAHKIIDTEGWASAARIDKDHPLLRLRFSGDMRDYETRLGLLQRVRLCLHFFTDRRWNPTTDVHVRLKKNTVSEQKFLKRPMAQEFIGRTASHTHTDTITYELSDSRSLFTSGDGLLVVKFDKVEGEQYLGGDNYYWRESSRAKDDDLSTSVLNFSGPSVTECKDPLKFFLSRLSLSSSATKIQRINFCALVDTANSKPKYVQLSGLITGKFSGSASFWADVSIKRFVYSIDNASGLIQAEDLIAPGTYFSISVPDGGLIRLYEAWLEIEYQWELSGKKTRLTLRRNGNVQPVSAVSVTLPSASRWQEFDVTDLVMSNGGWRFFSSEEPAIIEVEFNSQNDDTQIYLQEVNIIFDYRPVADEVVSQEIFADVQGMRSNINENELMVNPAEIIQFLLTDERFMGFSPELLDNESFASAREWFAQQGFRYSRVIDKKKSCGELLSEALKEAGAVLLNSGEKIKIVALGDVDSSGISSFSASPQTTLDKDIHILSSSFSEIINQVRVWYKDGDGMQMLKMEDRISQENSGVHPFDWYLRWHSPDSGGLAELCALVLRARAGNNLRVSLPHPLIASHIEPGDNVEVDLSYFFTLPMKGRVLSSELNEPTIWRMQLMLPAEGYRCREYDEKTFIRHLAGNLDKEVVIGGRAVARVDFKGTLRLRGEAFAFSLAEKYSAEPVWYEAETEIIYFGYQVSEGVYRGCFAITGEGDLLVLGSVVERYVMPGSYANGCYESTPEFFALSIDGTTVLLCYDVVNGTLTLKGELVERVIL